MTTLSTRLIHHHLAVSKPCWLLFRFIYSNVIKMRTMRQKIRGFYYTHYIDDDAVEKAAPPPSAAGTSQDLSSLSPDFA